MDELLEYNAKDAICGYHLTPRSAPRYMLIKWERMLDVGELLALLPDVRIAHFDFVALGGVLTLAWHKANEFKPDPAQPAGSCVFDIGAAWCSPEDRFCRKTGRRLATHRLLYTPHRFGVNTSTDIGPALQQALGRMHRACLQALVTTGSLPPPSAGFRVDPLGLAQRIVLSSLAPRWARKSACLLAYRGRDKRRKPRVDAVPLTAAVLDAWKVTLPSPVPFATIQHSDKKVPDGG